MKKAARIIVILLFPVAALLGLVFGRYSELSPFGPPYLWCFLAMLVWSIHLQRARVLVWNSAFLFLALAFAEFLLNPDTGINRMKGVLPDYPPGYHSDETPLGYGGPRLERSVVVTRGTGDSLMYRARYSTDRNGLRVTAKEFDSTRPPTYFFGGSFTFGEGVNDEQSLPWVYSELTGRPCVNFGFHGYGPHQMLRALELDLPAEYGYEKPDTVVCLMITAHLRRVVGNTNFGQSGPKYLLTDGIPQYVGAFADYSSPRSLKSILRKSHVLQTVIPEQLAEWSLQQQADMLLAILERANAITMERYGVPLTCIGLWGNKAWKRTTGGQGNGEGQALLQVLESYSGPAIVLPKLVPEFGTEEHFIPGDGHPNAAGIRVLAEGLQRRIGQSGDVSMVGSE